MLVVDLKLTKNKKNENVKRTVMIGIKLPEEISSSNLVGIDGHTGCQLLSQELVWPPTIAKALQEVFLL